MCAVGRVKRAASRTSASNVGARRRGRSARCVHVVCRKTCVAGYVSCPPLSFLPVPNNVIMCVCVLLSLYLGCVVGVVCEWVGLGGVMGLVDVHRCWKSTLRRA